MKTLSFLGLSSDGVASRHRDHLCEHRPVGTNLSPKGNRQPQRFVVQVNLVLVLLGLLLWWTPLEAATYYVDFVGGSDSNSGTSTSTPWKRVKGMTGVTSAAAAATLAGGDTIIFKGGVTWTNSWPWSLIGGSASAVTYTTDHTWFSGGSWSKPVFDQQEAGTNYATNAMISTLGVGWFTINDLKFYRCGVLGAVTNAVCLYFIDSHHVTLTNNLFDSRTWLSVFFNFSSAGTRSNFTVTGNEFTNTTSAVWFASSTSNAVEQNFTYTYNTIHDFGSMMGGGAHGDGFLHFFVNPYADATQYLDGFTFCNNRAYGDFTRHIPGSDQGSTGMIYQEGGIKNGLICNNDFSWFPYQNPTGAPGLFEAIINLRDRASTANGVMRVINNTVGGGPGTGTGAAMLVQQTGDVIAKNNIFYTGSFCVWSDDGVPTNVTLDYNLYSCPLGFLNAPANQGANSLGPPSNPQFVAFPNNLHITASSPAINHGQDLTSMGFPILTTTLDGLVRNSSWDIGAYQAQAGGDITPPAAPGGLTIR